MKRVLIDTDPGVDDAMALLLAFASPEVRITAITIVAGNVSLPLCVSNVRRILTVAKPASPPPLFRGAAAPLSGPTRDAAHVHGGDGLGGVTALRDAAGAARYPESTVAKSAEPAAEAIVRLAREVGQELTIIALGPLTNLALALQLDPGVLRAVGEVVIMGGAFRCPGNATPVAEFNIWSDPEAAQLVCDSGARLRWISLDITNHAPLVARHLEGRPGSRIDFVRDLTAEMLSRSTPPGEAAHCLLHDPMAVGAVLWPELFEFTPLRVAVECQGDLTRGMTVADFRSGASATPNGEVALTANTNEFRRRFLDALSERGPA